MALPLHLTKGYFFEWCTELPFELIPRISPVFFFQNMECYLQFERTACAYFLYLKPKVTSNKLKPFSVVIYCNYLRSDNFSRNKKFLSTSNCFIVYRFNESEIPANVPRQGYFVTFCLLFENQDGSLLPVENKIEDKSVQTGSYLNAEVSVESSYEDFSKLLDAGTDHDAEIKCGEQSIKVHKSILCTRSEVLSKMLQSNMKESKSGIIEIQDMDITSAHDFVRYLYTGAMPELTFDQAKVLYEAGDKYAVRSLMIRCSEYLQDNLSPENVVQCFALADAHSDQSLKDWVKTYMLEEKIYLQDELWLPFCDSYPREANEVYRLSHKRKASVMDDQ